MKKIMLALFCLNSLIICAQTSNTFYGLARKNTPNNEIFLATADPNSGVITNVNNTSLSQLVNLTGAALDPYNNFFHFMGYNEIKSVNLSTGATVNSVMINNPIADSYFDNFRFNNSDTSLYGLARRVLYDSNQNVIGGEVFLSTINVNTGTISQISPNSIAQGYALAGSAINPYLKVYYFSTGAAIIGVDMYTGLIYSSANIVNTNGIMFDNFTYSCVDSTLYGLIRQNYYDSIYDPSLMQWITFVDSTTIHLGKIDPITGIVTQISPSSISQGGYSLNAGSTIDPATSTYYYNNGYQLVGVNLLSGLIVSQPNLSNSNGQFFDLMRIQSNCFNAKIPTRKNPGNNPASANDKEILANFNIYPNPTQGNFTLESNENIKEIIVLDMLGQVIIRQTPNQRKSNIDLGNQIAGTYLIKVTGLNKDVYIRKIIKE